MKLRALIAALLALAPLAAAQATRARLTFEPQAAEVGESVRATLTFQHASDKPATLDSLGLDDSWVVLGSTPGVDVRDLEHPELATTTWTFEIASLEPGARTPGAIPLKCGAEKPAVDVAPLEIRGVLGEDEDAPRPLRGLRELQVAAERAHDPWTWIGGGAALACAALIAFSWWRIKRKPAEVHGTAPSIRLALLEAKPLDTPADVQAAHFALTRLLREALDLRTGRDHSGWTDEEWRAAAAPQLDALGCSDAERAQLDRLLVDAARVKYGPERPTHWATREALAAARALAVRFEAPLPEPERKRGVAA